MFETSWVNNRKTKMIRLKSILLLTVLVIFFGSGCVDKEKLRGDFNSGGGIENPVSSGASGDSSTADKSREISIQCSVAVLPFLLAMSEIKPAEMGISATAAGRNASIEAVANGDCDAAIFEDIGDVELYNATYERELAYCGVKFIVNKDNDLENITTDEIVRLFTGEENEIGGRKITLVVPEKDTSQRMILEQLFPLTGKVSGRMKTLIPDETLTGINDAEIADSVAADSSAIGVISISGDYPSVKELSLDGVFLDDVKAYPAKGLVKIIYGDSAKDAIENSLSNLSGNKDLFINNGFKPLL